MGIKITKAWIAKQARSNPTVTEWQVALASLIELEQINPSSLRYYSYTPTATQAIIVAMLTMRDSIDNEALLEQAYNDFDKNCLMRNNYKLEFRYDVAMEYLVKVGYVVYGPDGYVPTVSEPTTPTVSELTSEELSEPTSEELSEPTSKEPRERNKPWLSVKLSTAWIAKQARINPDVTEWQTAIRLVDLLNKARAGTNHYTVIQRKAVDAVVLALFTDTVTIDFEEMIAQYHADYDYLPVADGDKRYYDIEFRYDVYKSYLTKSGIYKEYLKARDYLDGISQSRY